MIQLLRGDILQDDAEALVNTVNCVGVMGRGIALQFKKAFPANFAVYSAACEAKEVRPGRMLVYETGTLTNPRWIINFPTKRHWRGKSRIEDIDAGLVDLVRVIREKEICSIALPPLGSGLGGLDWNVVRPRIEQALSPLEDVTIRLYEPGGSPSPDRAVMNREIPKMTAGRAALIELMGRYLDGLLDPFISLLEVHKLMYFMQEAGQPLQLRFRAAAYGPYAENLSHVLHAIEGHYVSGYSDGGDAPDKQLQLVPGAAEEASAFLADDTMTREKADRVKELVEGFESSAGLELLSTVHWVMKHGRARTEREVVERTYAWSERKRRFTERQIALASGTLTSRGWAHSLET